MSPIQRILRRQGSFTTSVHPNLSHPHIMIKHERVCFYKIISWMPTQIKHMIFVKIQECKIYAWMPSQIGKQLIVCLRFGVGAENKAVTAQLELDDVVQAVRQTLERLM